MSVRPDLLARLEACAVPPGAPGAVYLLPHATHTRFKVGWSVQPMQRIRQLPEYPVQLDLNGAQVAWFAQAQRARQVERVLHRTLAPYRVDLDHDGSGCTEWFSTRGFVLARRVVDVLLDGPGGPQHPQLVPLCEHRPTPEFRDELLVATSALDVWWRVEDLWSRLRVLLPLALEPDRELRRLFWIGLRRLEQPRALVLRAHALDLDTYEWHAEGRRHSLVTLMDWEGDHLMLQLTPSRRLRCWPEGEAVDDLMRGFIARQAVPRATASRSAPAPTA